MRRIELAGVNVGLSLAWREAFSELLRRPLRTLLTLLGLIFGVGAIVAMQAVGEGSRREAMRIVENLGLQNLMAEVKQQEDAVNQEARVRSAGLSRADAHASLEVVPGAKLVASEKQIKLNSVYSDSAAADARLSGVDPAWFQLSNLAVEKGRPLLARDDATLASVVVLGDQAADSLFPRTDPIGQLIKVNHVWLEVVGVLADRDSVPAEFEGVALTSDGNRLYIPIGTALARFRTQPFESEIDRMLLRLESTEQLASGARVLAALIQQRHGGVADFQVVVPLQLLQQHQRTQRIFRIVMSVIAGVSMIVGGIGIMNIMLANVLERQHEIGLMRAIGAKQGDIVAQFLREAAVVCLVGCLVGSVFGVSLAYLIAALAGWQVAWAPIPVLVAIALCFAVGLSFGVYPARYAAKLDPVVAIRGE